MENMKSLADQLRKELEKPKTGAKKGAGGAIEKAGQKSKPHEKVPAILEAIRAYDNSGNKSMVHARFDEKTVQLMNRFKMATDVDVTKFVSFAVRHLLETCPELKTIIKQFIQNTEL